MKTLPEMVRLGPRETQTLMALLEALDIPNTANCTAKQRVEALLAIERKLGRNLRNDTAQGEQFLASALHSVESD